MHMSKQHNKGFTLVEMIVVIAIIAILAAVIIPTTAGFIDRARLSNDRSNAAYMTRALQTMAIESPELFTGGVTAYDVKEYLDNFGETPFDYTPTARDAGYFYLEDLNQVIVAKYEEAEGIIEQQLHQNQGMMLFNPQRVSANQTTFNSPEEIFGDGALLLTDEGAAIAMIVNFISKQLPLSNNLTADHAEALSALDDLQGSLFANLFGRSMSSRLETTARNFLEYYNPTTTLYVHSDGWKTAATEGASITKAVFVPGTSNLAPFNVEVSGALGISQLVIPRTVKSGEKGALTSGAFASTSITMLSSTFKIPADTTLSEVLGSVSTSGVKVSTNEITMFYGGMILDTVEGDYEIDVMMATLRSQGETVTALRFEIDLTYPRRTRLYVYSENGLIAIATPYVKSPFAD